MRKVKVTWATKLKTYIENRPAYIVLGLLVLFVSQLLTIKQGINNLSDYYKETINWKKTEEVKINRISAGLNVSLVQDLLGTPILTKKSKSGTLEQKIFRGKGYWVQTINDANNSIVFYTITVCDQTFHPKYVLPALYDKNIILGMTTFDELEPLPGNVDVLDYFVGNTAPSFFFDQVYLGNPSNYQNIVWGISTVCENSTTNKISNTENGVDSNAPYDIFKASDCGNFLTCQKDNFPMDDDKLVKTQLNCGRYDYSCDNDSFNNLIRFRKSSAINTIGATAPFFNPRLVRDDFLFGPDRIDLRVLPQESEKPSITESLSSWLHR